MFIISTDVISKLTKRGIMLLVFLYSVTGVHFACCQNWVWDGNSAALCLRMPYYCVDVGVFLGLRSAPHSGQKFEVTGMRVWHLGQISTTGLYWNV